MRITTELLGDHPALTSIECGFPITGTWIRGGQGFIGFGVYRTVHVRGAKRFHDAQNWWHEQLKALDIKNSVHGVGTGPILFASFSFDENEPSVLIIPQVVVVEKGDKSWITWIGDEQPNLSEAVRIRGGQEFMWSKGSLGDIAWCERVDQAVERIKRGDLEKVVLARDELATTAAPINSRSLLQALEEEYPSTWLYYIDGLVGATPELLVRLNKTLVTSRVLAGTIRRTGDEEKDLALAGSLARSSKDLEEHEYAVRSVAESLAPFASSTNVPETPFVLHLPNVMHLATDVTGVINDSVTQIDIFTLTAALHPSAAVCGTPTDRARTLIQEIESLNRGRYAGPVGWIDARGDGEFGIALRCGQISEDQKSIRLFAGCGVVAGSDPAKELAESQAKLAPVKSALTRL
jgi:menaquinone-specific isochorismate synthase